MRRGSTLGEAVNQNNSLVADKACSSILKGRKRTAKHVQDGALAILAGITTSTSSSLAHIDKDARYLVALQTLENFQSSFQTSR